MAFDNIMHTNKRYLIVHDAIGYVYLLSINQVSSTELDVLFFRLSYYFEFSMREGLYKKTLCQ